MKPILIAVIIAAVLLLVVSPSVAAACMDRTADNCDSNPFQEGAAIPLCCCLTAGWLSCNCSLSNSSDNEVLLPNRSTLEENVYMALPQTSVTTETSPNPKKPLQREPSQELPSCLYTEYHCRNCLDSEEPPQV